MTGAAKFYDAETILGADAPRMTMGPDWPDYLHDTVLVPNPVGEYPAFIYENATTIPKSHMVLMSGQLRAAATRGVPYILGPGGHHLWAPWEYAKLNGYRDITIEPIGGNKNNGYLALMGEQAYHQVPVRVGPFAGKVSRMTEEDMFIFMRWSENLRYSYEASDRGDAVRSSNMVSAFEMGRQFEKYSEVLTKWVKDDQIDLQRLRIAYNGPDEARVRIDEDYTVYADKADTPGGPFLVTERSSDKERIGRHLTLAAAVIDAVEDRAIVAAGVAAGQIRGRMLKQLEVMYGRES